MKQCQSCGMPLDRDPSGQGGGTEKDGSISQMRCSLCYCDGAFVGKECTLEQMQALVDTAMKEQGFGIFMRKISIWQLPHLARWKDTTVPVYRFKRKRYGYGRTPATRQGRACIALYLLFFWWWIARFNDLDPDHISSNEVVRTFFPSLLLASALLIGVCYRKGESPKRQRGKKKV